MTDELRLSVSKTKCFSQCKAQFNFNYNLKLPKKERDYHIFGKFCHKVLEDFHLAYINGSDKPFHEMMGISFKVALEEFGASMTKEMKKECWDLINKYLKIVTVEKSKNLSSNVIACEKNFSIFLKDNLILNGFIDRIQIDADNVIHVADYKTTKNKKYLKSDWFQLLTYAYVIHLENPMIEVVRASYILLRHDFEYITTEFKIPEILSIKDKYIDYAVKILGETEYAPSPTILCKYCDYLEFCDAGKAHVKPDTTYGEITY